jgi:quinol monooxygenase YgiN
MGRPPKIVHSRELVSADFLERIMGITLPELPPPAPDEKGPYCVIAQHRALPGKADAYERRMLADIPLTRSEPGCLAFHIHRDRADPNLFVIYEVWRDMDALRDHFKTPYVQQFVVDSAEYIDGDMQVQWLVMSTEYQPGKR